MMMRLIAHAPQHLLWGSDWPHVNLHGPMPDDGDLVDLLGSVTTPRERQAILVDNPTAFFHFPNRARVASPADSNGGGL
jgi:predicted TIM-barrel fold metal-dependent hydrolase